MFCWVEGRLAQWAQLGRNGGEELGEMLIGIYSPWSLSCQVDDRIEEVVETGDIGEDMILGIADGVLG